MNFFSLIFLVIIVITFSQKVMSDSHDQNIVEKAKEAGIEAPYNEAIIEIGKKIKEKELSLDINNVQHLASLMNKSSLIP